MDSGCGLDDRVKIWIKTWNFWNCFLVGPNQLSNEEIPGCLGYIGDYSTQLYDMGIIVNHCKDPY